MSFRTNVTFVMLVLSVCSIGFSGEPRLHKDLEVYVAQREAEFDLIPTMRKESLQQLSDYLRECRVLQKPARLIFVCTHNSRRSHISQLWASVAAARYGLDNIETFSGGTECTAFNPRAVSALKRAGFELRIGESGDNPKYLVSFGKESKPLLCFSKLYSDPVNPSAEFCAVMTCSSADESCPSVKGAVKRIAIPYEDPKIADDTIEETSKYDERTAQICREILFAFSKSL